MSQNVRQVIRKKLQKFEESELKALLSAMLAEKKKRKVGKKQAKK